MAGSALIALSILICRELGGDRWGQLLTGLAVLFAPGRLVTDSLMTMNAFEPIYWMCCVLVVTRILRTGNSRLWPWFGLFAGLGLENKHSTLFFGFALTVALLLTPHRREFAKQWIWIAGAGNQRLPLLRSRRQKSSPPAPALKTPSQFSPALPR